MDAAVLSLWQTFCTDADSMQWTRGNDAVTFKSFGLICVWCHVKSLFKIHRDQEEVEWGRFFLKYRINIAFQWWHLVKRKDIQNSSCEMQKMTVVRTVSIYCLTDLLTIHWEFVGNEKNFRYKTLLYQTCFPIAVWISCFMLKDILVEMNYLLNNSSVSYCSVWKKIVICGEIISYA